MQIKVKATRAGFWETSFRNRQEMRGWTPADSADETVELFKKYGLNKILIPGFGYGSNAKIFTHNSCKVEISKATFKKDYGGTSYFYDLESIQADFGDYGLVDARAIREPIKDSLI